MDSELTRKGDKRTEGQLVVPYSSRRRMLLWVKQRFALTDRKYFWVTICFVSASVLASSGLLLSAMVRIPLYIFSKMPLIGPYISEWVNGTPGQAFVRYIEWMLQHSPVDKGILLFFSLFDGIGSMPNNEEFALTGGIVSLAIILIALARLLRSPAHLGVSERGLSLGWQSKWFSLNGPVVAWSDVKGIVLKRHGGDNSPDGKIEVSYATPRWQYKLFQRADEVGSNKFSIDLRNLDTLEQRHVLCRAFEQWAPPLTVQSDVCEVLTATQSNSYTELWLQALSAPSKRQSLEPLETGKELREGRYLIGEQLGVGGQGTAYAARDNEPDDEGHVIDLVVKEFVMPVYVDSNSRKDALRRFLDEADLLKRLDNERVVKLSDCFVEDHRGYLVLERIHGNSLKHLVSVDGPMTEETVSGLLEQMLDVLSYLHGQEPPVVHRDFAPDNLILGKDGVLKLVDFNVAQQSENSMTGTIVGKQSYVPPEQLRGMATPASDIYALGATLYFVLTGSDPEPLSVSHPRETVPHVSRELDEIVARCTALDEKMRFQSVSEIRSLLPAEGIRNVPS